MAGPRLIEGPGGQVVEFPEGTSDNVIEVSMRRAFGGPSPSAPAAPESQGFDVGRMLRGAARDIYGQLTQGLGAEPVRQAAGVVDPIGETVTSRVVGERPRLDALATVMRSAPGFVPGPWKAAGASAVGETGAQGVEMLMGDRAQFDPLAIGTAAAIPPVVHGLSRVATAVPSAVSRMWTRTNPAQFAAKHQAAQEAGRELVQKVGPAAGAVAEAGAQAERLSGELVPIPKLVSVLESPNVRNLARLKNVSPENKLVLDTVENIRGVMTPEGMVDVGGLEAVRRNIGYATGEGAKELNRIYGALVSSLEDAGAAGGAGAQAARDMATAFKQTLGAKSIERALESATATRAISGADVKILNMGRFGQLVDKQREQLTKQIGAEGVAALNDFTQRFRNLPPDQANLAWNMLTGMVGAGTSALTGAVSPGVGFVATPLGFEFIRNLGSVIRQPGAWEQLMAQIGTATAQAGRGQMTSQDRIAVKERLGEQMQDLQRRYNP